jgi:tRNA1Val (adenine37-N6)-methyltransferase
MNSLPPHREDETVDEILGGRLRIIQKKQGYRFSLDALLLAHFAAAREGETVVDLGTGSGIIALTLAGLGRCRKVVGIDIQEAFVTMAWRSAVLNGLAGRVEIRCADVRHPETFCPADSFDCAVFNPPYRRLRSGRMNLDQGKALARHEIEGSVADFLSAAARILRVGGRVAAIYPATRMVELLFRMRGLHLEPKRLQIVHSRAGARGEFVLVEGVRGGREALTVLPPLFIYGEENRYTEEMEAIFRELSAFPAAVGDRSPLP